MQDVESQNKSVLKWLREHKAGITPREADDECQIMRLAARIFDLRKLGHQINTVRERSPCGRKQWARYVLIKEAGADAKPAA